MIMMGMKLSQVLVYVYMYGFLFHLLHPFEYSHVQLYAIFVPLCFPTSPIYSGALQLQLQLQLQHGNWSRFLRGERRTWIQSKRRGKYIIQQLAASNHLLLTSPSPYSSIILCPILHSPLIHLVWGYWAVWWGERRWIWLRKKRCNKVRYKPGIIN